MKVLVTSMPGPGHVHPVVPVVEALKRSGHDVLWAVGPAGVDRVHSYGFRAVSAGPAPAMASAAGADLAGVPPRERRALTFGKRFGAAARRMRPDLAGIADEMRPDLIVHDIAELAAPAVAASRGIPKVTVAFSGPLSERLLQGIVAEVADVWRDEGLEVPSDAGLYGGIYLHRFPASLGPSPPGSTVRTVRPVVFDGASGEPPEWATTLGKDRRAVYVTLGTVVASAPQWTELLAALGSMDLDAVATTGTQVDPGGIGPIPTNVQVERYVPQSFILGRVAAVVSHAGAGTMLAAADRGLPQLCIPMGADMWDNADAVSGAGAGITLEEDGRDQDAIRAALHRLLDDPSFGIAARSIANEIATLPHPESAVGELEALKSRPAE